MSSKRADRSPERDLEEKAETEKMWQERRLLAAQYVMDGMSLREAARKIGGVTHQFVKIWAAKLLDRHPPDADNNEPSWSLKEGHELLLQSKKPGPAPGRCPKADEIIGLVKKEKS